MIEVYPNLFVGSDADCRPGKWTIHACKTCHMRVYGQLKKGHPNYLFGYRGKSLFLNLIDTDQIKEYTDLMMKEAMGFIDKHISEGVLIHCNQGLSRAPSVAYLWLKKPADFKYPLFSPSPGMRAYIDAS